MSKIGSYIRDVFKTFSVLVSLIILGVILGGGVFLYKIFGNLPDVALLKSYHHDHSTEVFSADGLKIGEFTFERRYPVKFEEIPDQVVKAFIAAEDSKFYEHAGIDFVGIIRAAFSNIMAGKYAQGASTITQQVARRLLLESRKKEITRKVREMILAYQMEKELTKNEILALYMSDIFLGHRAYGLRAAAQNYFRKRVQDLDLAETSLLAGLPQRPTYWNPFKSPYAAKRRQRYVLGRMVADGYISQAEADAAYNQPITLYPVKGLNTEMAPYFTEYVRIYLTEKYGEEKVQTGGYKVHTTVRYDFQKKAEAALDTGLRETDKRMGWRGVKLNVSEDPQKILEFVENYHKEKLEEVVPARVLPAQVLKETDELELDLRFLEAKNSPFYGPTPLEQGKIYKAVITEVDKKGKSARASIGKTDVTLPLDKNMDWVLLEERRVTDLNQILRKGDVVELKVEVIDRSKRIVTTSLEQAPEVQGALLSYNVHSGFVEAMVGGRNFLESAFNRALQAKRQVGSTFKPLIYAAAVDKGFSPSSVVTDSPVVFRFETGEEGTYQGEDWKPSNYSEQFVGEMTLRTALVKSKNVPTIKVLNEIGVDYTIDYARRLGIKSDFPRDLTIALGSWSSSLEELTRAYAIFPRLGKPINLHYITKVVAPNGDVLEEYKPEDEDILVRAPFSKDGPQVTRETDSLEPGVEEALESENLLISPQTAFVMTDFLSAVVAEGTGRGASGVPGKKAGKTGTSNDFRDAWFIGYTPQVMTGVWVGYDEGDISMAKGEGGGRAAVPVWREYMNYAAAQYPREDFPIPNDIVFAYVDRESGKLATSRTPNRVRVAFKVGGVPNTEGDNVPRIREPGVRATSTSRESVFSETERGSQGLSLRESDDESDPSDLSSPEPATGVAPPASEPMEDSSENLGDLMRDGYE